MRKCTTKETKLRDEMKKHLHEIDRLLNEYNPNFFNLHKNERCFIRALIDRNKEYKIGIYYEKHDFNLDEIIEKNNL